MLKKYYIDEIKNHELILPYAKKDADVVKEGTGRYYTHEEVVAEYYENLVHVSKKVYGFMVDNYGEIADKYSIRLPFVDKYDLESVYYDYNLNDDY